MLIRGNLRNSDDNKKSCFSMINHVWVSMKSFLEVSIEIIVTNLSTEKTSRSVGSCQVAENRRSVSSLTVALTTNIGDHNLSTTLKCILSISRQWVETSFSRPGQLISSDRMWAQKHRRRIESRGMRRMHKGYLDTFNWFTLRQISVSSAGLSARSCQGLRCQKFWKKVERKRWRWNQLKFKDSNLWD